MKDWFSRVSDLLLYRPAYLIEDLLALLLVVRGIFYWLLPDETYVAQDAFAFVPVVVTIMVMFIIPGVMVLCSRGVKNKKRRECGLFLTATMYGVGAVLAILMIGFTPTTWLYPFGGSLIVGALWLRSKMNGDVFDEQNEVYFQRRWEAFRSSRQ